MATLNKLIFPSAITRLLHHFSVSFLESPHFMVMCAIDVAIIQWSEAQLMPRRPRTETVTPLVSTTPSTFAPSSTISEVTLEAIMAQFLYMDACLDTLSDELC